MWRHDTLVELSPTEFRLLRYLLLNAERVLWALPSRTNGSDESL